jgi:hypothetical protein
MRFFWIFVFAWAWLAAGVISAQDLPRARLLPVANSCFLNSVLICEEIKKRFQQESLWCDILAVAFLREQPGETMQEAHAVAVVEYGGGLYYYDVNVGTLPILLSVITNRTDMKENAVLLARAIWPEKKITDARFLAKWNQEMAMLEGRTTHDARP